jgi:hypothetical protein
MSRAKSWEPAPCFTVVSRLPGALFERREAMCADWMKTGTWECFGSQGSPAGAQQCSWMSTIARSEQAFVSSTFSPRSPMFNSLEHVWFQFPPDIRLHGPYSKAVLR